MQKIWINDGDDIYENVLILCIQAYILQMQYHLGLLDFFKADNLFKNVLILFNFIYFIVYILFT